MYNFAWSNNIANTFCSSLPSGRPQANYSQSLCIRAFDALNAFTDLCFETVQVYPYGYLEQLEAFANGTYSAPVLDQQRIASVTDSLMKIIAKGWKLCFHFHIIPSFTV